MSPVLLVLIFGLLLVMVLASSFVRRQAAAIRASDALAMRDRFLRATAGDLGVSGEADEPFSVVMDVARRDGVASLVSAANGDANIYLSNGAGLLGGIGHESVRVAAVAFVREAARHASGLAPTEEFPLPLPGRVRFYARAAAGLRMADASESELREGRHPLSPLYAAGQRVVNALRQVAPQR